MFWLLVAGWVLRSAAVVLPVIGLLRLYLRERKFLLNVKEASKPWEPHEGAVVTPDDWIRWRIQNSPWEGMKQAKLDFLFIGVGLLLGLVGEILFAVA